MSSPASWTCPERAWTLTRAPVSSASYSSSRPRNTALRTIPWKRLGRFAPGAAIADDVQAEVGRIGARQAPGAIPVVAVGHHFPQRLAPPGQTARFRSVVRQGKATHRRLDGQREAAAAHPVREGEMAGEVVGES